MVDTIKLSCISLLLNVVCTSCALIVQSNKSHEITLNGYNVAPEIDSNTNSLIEDSYQVSESNPNKANYDIDKVAPCKSLSKIILKGEPFTVKCLNLDSKIKLVYNSDQSIIIEENKWVKVGGTRELHLIAPNDISSIDCFDVESSKSVEFLLIHKNVPYYPNFEKEIDKQITKVDSLVKLVGKSSISKSNVVSYDIKPEIASVITSNAAECLLKRESLINTFTTVLYPSGGNDVPQLQDAIQNGSKVILSSGEYKISSPITIFGKQSVSIIGEDATFLITDSYQSNNANIDNSVIGIRGCANIIIDGITFKRESFSQAEKYLIISNSHSICVCNCVFNPEDKIVSPKEFTPIDVYSSNHDIYLFDNTFNLVAGKSGEDGGGIWIRQFAKGESHHIIFYKNKIIKKQGDECIAVFASLSESYIRDVVIDSCTFKVSQHDNGANCSYLITLSNNDRVSNVTLINSNIYIDSGVSTAVVRSLGQTRPHIVGCRIMFRDFCIPFLCFGSCVIDHCYIDGKISVSSEYSSSNSHCAYYNSLIRSTEYYTRIAGYGCEAKNCTFIFDHFFGYSGEYCIENCSLIVSTMANNLSLFDGSNVQAQFTDCIISSLNKKDFNLCPNGIKGGNLELNNCLILGMREMKIMSEKNGKYVLNNCVLGNSSNVISGNINKMNCFDANSKNYLEQVIIH